jgi:hypothetical protein
MPSFPTRPSLQHAPSTLLTKCLCGRDKRRIPTPFHGIAGLISKRLWSPPGRHLKKLFEGWMVATPDRRRFAVRITSYPELDISVPFEWNVTAAEVTERVRAAIED